MNVLNFPCYNFLGKEACAINMNSIDELEEGEIEDLSDNDDHQKNTSSTKTHESSVTALKNKSKKCIFSISFLLVFQL